MNGEDAAKKYAWAYQRGRPRHRPGDEFSIRHPGMPLSQRAKIFSPFSALKGFEEAIDRKRVRYVDRRELTEEEQRDLDQTLLRLRELTRNSRAAKANRVEATVLYYVPCQDENHEAYGQRGSYERLTGPVWEEDPMLTRSLRIGEARIELADIAQLRIEPTQEEES